MKRFLLFWPAVLILLGGATVFLCQQETTRQLQREFATRRVTIRELQRLRGENERLRGLVAAPDRARAMEQTQAEIARLRLEIATWETKRQSSTTRAQPPAGGSPPAGVPAHPSPTAMAAELVAGPRPLRIAEFQNIGQATPSAAFQTLIWGLANADHIALEPLLGMSTAGREKLQAIVDGMPAESRAQFKDPAQLLAMLLELDLLKHEGFQLTGETPQDSTHVVLRVRYFNDGKVEPMDRKIPLQRGPYGWQLEISDQIIDDVPQMLIQASQYVPPPRKQEQRTPGAAGIPKRPPRSPRRSKRAIRPGSAACKVGKPLPDPIP